MNTEQIRHFVAVARTGSVTSAAREQHISQPALSRSLRHLEEELGTPLFDRAKNSLTLNQAGKEVLPHAEELLSAERRIRQTAQDVARRDRVLRLGTIAPAPLWYLTSLIVDQLPGTLVSSELMSDEADLEHALFDSLIDLAVASREVPGMRCTLLMRESLYLSAPKDHPLASRDSVSFSDLNGETFLLYGGIGFWWNIHQRMMPNARIVRQDDREVWRQLMHTTRMLGFTSDAPRLARPNVADANGAQVERVFVPISDNEAHASFYLCIREDDFQKGGAAANVFDFASRIDASKPFGVPGGY